MTDVAYEASLTTGSNGNGPNDEEQLWRRRIAAAEYHRRPLELEWLSSLAFAAGQQWVVVDRMTRTLRDISEVDPRYADVDLYVADIITEQRGAALGELQADSDRPELVTPGDADTSPQDDGVAAQANRAISHGWDFEWDGDEQLMDVRRKCVDLGVAAVRVMFDPYAGGAVNASDGTQVQAPVGADGEPITDAAKAHEFVAQQAQSGQTAQFKPLNQGCIRWQTGSAFNLLTPPGVPHEKDFPWEIWVRPAPLDDVKAEYPSAADLMADSNIGSVLGITVAQGSSQPTAGGQPPRLADHVWLYTCFQRPNRKHPQGRVAILAGNQKRLLRTIPRLPIKTVDGTYRSGVVYFHWWRHTDRFHSRGLITTLKDPQRMVNRTATQTQELIDRSMPFGIVEEGSMPEKPTGRPMEWQEVSKGTQVTPQWVTGPGPGPWMAAHRQQLMDDAQHASTLSALKLGENPAHVDTYSQLALLQDQEASKRSTIRSQHQHAVARLVEYSLELIRQYWTDGKQLMVAGGGENVLQTHDFAKTAIPPLYIVRPAKGSAKPRSQASQLQLVKDIWDAAVASLAVQADPLGWVNWLKNSYEAGEPLELPSPPVDNQADVAERENTAMLNGEQPAVAYWDLIGTHLPIHRQAEDIARVAGDTAALQRIENHIHEHQTVAAEISQQVAAAHPPAQLATPGSTPVPSGGPPVAPVPAPPPPPVQ